MVIQLAPIIPQELPPEITKPPSPGALLRSRSWSVIGESQDPTPCHTPRLSTITFTRSLVWRRRRFVCDNCLTRHLEDHPEFENKLTRRLSRRLVADARVMTLRAAARRHGLS